MEKGAFLDRLIWGSDAQEVMVYQALLAWRVIPSLNIIMGHGHHRDGEWQRV